MKLGLSSWSWDKTGEQWCKLQRRQHLWFWPWAAKLSNYAFFKSPCFFSPFKDKLILGVCWCDISDCKTRENLIGWEKPGNYSSVSLCTFLLLKGSVHRSAHINWKWIQLCLHRPTCHHVCSCLHMTRIKLGYLVIVQNAQGVFSSLLVCICFYSL